MFMKRDGYVYEKRLVYIKRDAYVCEKRCVCI